jgi:hypothetical protein
MAAYADAVDRALADPDPWAGFCGTWRRFAAYMIQACSAGSAAPLPPPELVQMHRAVLRLQQAPPTGKRGSC